MLLQNCGFVSRCQGFICTVQNFSPCQHNFHCSTTTECYILLLTLYKNNKFNISNSVINTGEKQISDSKLHQSEKAFLCNNIYCGEIAHKVHTQSFDTVIIRSTAPIKIRNQTVHSVQAKLFFPKDLKTARAHQCYMYVQNVINTAYC